MIYFSIIIVPEFPDDEDSTGSDMSEYDWSEGSNDELGSPSKMPKAVKKSSLKKSKPKVGNQNGELPHLKATSKSVRFSTPDSAVPTEPVVSSPEMVTPVAASSQDAASSVSRPTNLIPISHGQSDPSPTKPSNRPTSIPPPVPARPPRQKESFKALNKPSSVVKPSAPPPPPPPTAEKRDKKLVALMDAMDRELAATDVGKSFEREPIKVIIIDSKYFLFYSRINTFSFLLLLRSFTRVLTKVLRLTMKGMS